MTYLKKSHGFVLLAAIGLVGLSCRAQAPAQPTAAEISIIDLGAVADNKTDISDAFQTAIDQAASFPNGGTIHIPAGQYVLKKTIRLRPKVNIDVSSSARIRAGEKMPTMIDTDVGSSKTRLRGQSVRGGVWDGKTLAERVFLLRDFNTVCLEDMTLLDCQSAYIEIDGRGAFSSCYELILRNIEITRTKGAGPRPDGCAGIRSGFDKAGLSDSHFSDLIISGVEHGLSGSFYVSKFSGIHVWGFGPTQGRVDAGFYMRGQGNQFVLCQVDNPRKYGWYIEEDGTQIGHSCITYGTGGDWLQGDQAVCVYVADASEGAFHVTVDNNRWNVQSKANPMAAEFSGDLRGLRAHNNTIRNDAVLAPYGDAGPGELEAALSFSFSANGAPEIGGRINVKSVVQGAPGCVTVQFDRPLSNHRYGVHVDLVAAPNPAGVPAWFLTRKTEQGFDLQFSPAEACSNIQRVNIQCVGGK